MGETRVTILALANDTPILAATDLTNHLACPHLTQQRLAIARKERAKPRAAEDPHAELIRKRGDAFEAEQLVRLSEEAGGHADLSGDIPFTLEDLEATSAATVDAMQAGHPLIYQAQFLDGSWQGRADFLRRIPVPSDLGDHSYELIDTKLARHVKPGYVHQLVLYNRLLAAVQGYEPQLAHIVLGDGASIAIDLRRYGALHRHVVRQLEAIVARPTELSYPDPVDHCGICALWDECRATWRGDDHLSLVARIRRDQRESLVGVGIAKTGTLAETDTAPPHAGLGDERYSLLHNQAALQVVSRESGEPVHRHLAPARAAGYAALPPASDADIFFDLEGDPYIGNGGIEYLWGWWTVSGGYECTWAHDAAAEKEAFERFVDYVSAAHAESPDLHVYHYAPHERAKLRSLSIEYATREVEIDALLRAEVFVDLFAVVRHAVQVGEESYSLKALERHHGFRRLEKRVREGGGSIVAYETWLATQDADWLEAIRAYNEEDCRSTWMLREWLANDMTPEAERELGVDFDDWREPEEDEEREPPAWMPDALELIGRLADDLSIEPEDDTVDEAERRLLSHLILYHWREGKPVWWRYFDLRGQSLDDLRDDRDALAYLERDESIAPIPVKRSFDYAFAFPPQEFRLRGDVSDPTTDEGYNLVRVEDDRVYLRRGVKAEPPAPVALVASQPVNTGPLREAIVALSEAALAGEERFRAARDILRRVPPRAGVVPLGPGVDELKQATLKLDYSALPVQGPPGTGKTYRGARMIVAALKAKKRVGVSAFSHAAIKNLLREVERVAHRENVEFTGVYRGDDYEGPHGLIETAGNQGVTDAHQLIAGTAWLFAQEKHREKLDILFVDEAGQQSLASSVASALAAKSVVLLGDPQQLPQVTQAEHPAGSGASVLEHILAGESIIQPGHGVLLTESWRMHPDVCSFVSERSYDGELRSLAACGKRHIEARQGSLTGTGLRAMAIEHHGRSQSSPEEAEAVATACRDLLADAVVTDDEANTRTLTPADILVVAPYNLAVDAIRKRVPAGVRVGTVDKFQGQEAPVVFYAMTCSSGEDVPRGLDFLFDSHRLNVAISRAQCLAVLVHSPRLLDADCRTLEQMELVDGVCRFVEMTEPIVRT